LKNDSRYSRFFTEKGFWKKVKSYSRTAGMQVVYIALLLYYLMQSRSVPIKAKATIAAALGYFILPIDLIPDIALVAGFTDDLTVLMVALSQVSRYITDDVIQSARTRLRQWFTVVDKAYLENLGNHFSIIVGQ
jgi:uncharacterized membrane protein YkvA (DUF1232 family)